LLKSDDESIDDHTVTRSASVKTVTAVSSAPSTKKVLEFHDVEVSCTGKILRDGKPVPEAVYTGCDYPADCSRRANGTCALPTRTLLPLCDEAIPPLPLKGTADIMIVITQEYPGAYYHYVSEGLTRLTYVREQYPDLLENSKVLIHTSADDAISQDWARLMGISTKGGKDTRLVRGRWMAKKAIYPPSNDCFDPDKHALQGMQSALESLHPGIRKALPLEGAPPTALLLQRAHKRVILNHDDVVQKLQEAGWEVEVLSELDMPNAFTQCSMFHRAQMIAGPHGAGFSNLVCARVGTPVIEFEQDPPPTIDCFKNMAKKLGLSFTGIPSTMTHTGNGTVDTLKVKEVATSMLAQLSAA